MIIAPTDNIAELGWFIIDVNSLIPNIPRLEIVKVLPSISVGFNFFSFALFAKSLTVSEIDWIFWLSANLITGTIIGPWEQLDEKKMHFFNGGLYRAALYRMD